MILLGILAGSRSHTATEVFSIVLPSWSLGAPLKNCLSHNCDAQSEQHGTSRAKVTSVVLIERPTDVCLTRRWRARVNGLTLKRKPGDDRIREAVLGGAFSAAGETRTRHTGDSPWVPRETEKSIEWFWHMRASRFPPPSLSLALIPLLGEKPTRTTTRRRRRRRRGLQAGSGRRGRRGR